MRTRLITAITLSLLLTGCTLPTSFTQSFSPAALDVDSTPNAEVFLNGTSVGKTPIKNKRLSAGTYTVKLKTDSQTWSDQITLVSSTVTIINRQFLQDSPQTAGEIVSLTPGEGVAVIGTPQESQVQIDGDSVGKIPAQAKNLSPGIHEIRVTADDYQTRILKARIAEGYKLIASVDLAKLSDIPATTSATKSSASSQQTTPSPSQIATVRVTKTPTGWVRVRQEASLASPEVFKATTGDELELIEEKSDWMHVKAADGKTGWASTTYLQKQ